MRASCEVLADKVIARRSNMGSSGEERKRKVFMVVLIKLKPLSFPEKSPGRFSFLAEWHTQNNSVISYNLSFNVTEMKRKRKKRDKRHERKHTTGTGTIRLEEMTS